MKQFEQMQAFYENEGREQLRFMEGNPHYLEFLTASHYLLRTLKPGSRILDSCAGAGAYALLLARQGHMVTAGDIVPYNVELMEQAQSQEPLLSEIYCGDTLDLSRFAPESFDAVLCMGALYHLHDPAERQRAVSESLRVLKPGGILACTYMNRYAVILNNIAGDVENIDEILSFVQDGHEGIFYASTPEENIQLISDFGVQVLHHVALDGVSIFLHDTTGLISDEGLQRFKEYHFAVCEVPSLLGCSYHNLLIGRK